MQKSKDYVNQGGEQLCVNMRRRPIGAWAEYLGPGRPITRRDSQSRRCLAQASRKRLYRRSPDPQVRRLGSSGRDHESAS